MIIIALWFAFAGDFGCWLSKLETRAGNFTASFRLLVGEIDSDVQGGGPDAELLVSGAPDQYKLR